MLCRKTKSSERNGLHKKRLSTHVRIQRRQKEKDKGKGCADLEKWIEGTDDEQQRRNLSKEIKRGRGQRRFVCLQNF